MRLRALILVLFVLIIILVSISIVSSADDLIALQGNVQQAGAALASGDLVVTLYDAYSGGNLIYNSTTDFDRAISNGKFDIIVGNGTNELHLEYGKLYYMELVVGGEKFSFNGADRQVFQSSTGQINATAINPRQINMTHLELNINLSNATGIEGSDVIKATGTNWVGELLDSILDTIYTWIEGVNTTANLQNLLNDTGIYSTYNATYAANLDTNESLTISYMNATWVSTYNATYASNIDTNDSIVVYTSNDTWTSTYNATYAAFQNETQRIANITDYACPAGYLVSDFAANGTVICTADTDTDTNDSVALYNMNDTWVSTYNETYIGAINNESYLSTYNATYAGLINNGSYLSTYNATYSDYAYNQSINVPDNAIQIIQANVTDFWNGVVSSTIANNTYLNATHRGEINFNGGWQSAGLTISNGNLFAQTIYVYNVTSLGVNELVVNGSLFPQAGFDNTFDLGNSSLQWREGYFGTEVYIGGNDISKWLYNQSQNIADNAIQIIQANVTDFWNGVVSSTIGNATYARGNESANLHNMNDTWVSTYNATYAGYAPKNPFDQQLNTTNAVKFDTLNLSDDLVFVTNGNLMADTADGSDNQVNMFCGGGGCATDRGGYIAVYGNEYATLSGNTVLAPGQATGAIIALGGNTNVTNSGSLTIDGGALNIGSATGSKIGDINATGNATVQERLVVGTASKSVTLGDVNISGSYWGDGSKLTGVSTYNATYQGIFDTNNDSYLSTYNATYALYAYNMTTQPLNIITGNNDSWFSTYNATYEGIFTTNNDSYFSTYNATYEGIFTTNNDSYFSTYNATYAPYAYNMTQAARNIFNQQLNNTDSPKFNYLNLTGYLNSTANLWLGGNLTIIGNSNITGGLNVSKEGHILALNIGSATGAGAGDIHLSGDIVLAGDLNMDTAEPIRFFGESYPGDLNYLMGLNIDPTARADGSLGGNTIQISTYDSDTTGFQVINQNHEALMTITGGGNFTINQGNLTVIEGLNVGSAAGAGIGDINLSGKLINQGSGAIFGNWIGFKEGAVGETPDWWIGKDNSPNNYLCIGESSTGLASEKFCIAVTSGQTVAYFGSNIQGDEVQVCYGACGTQNLATGAGDLYVEDDLEIDGLGSTSGTTLVVDANGGIYKSSSSLRYKTDVKDLYLDPTKIQLLNPVSFTWNNNSATPGARDIGLIAEEVYEVYPEAVFLDTEGKPESIVYDKITLALVAAYKQQQITIEEQGYEIKNLKIELCRKDNTYSFCEELE